MNIRPEVLADTDTGESEMSVEKEFKVIEELIKSDDEYAWGWHCNLAMPIHDEGVSYVVANKAAGRIMASIFGVDTTNNRFYRVTGESVSPQPTKKDPNDKGEV